MSRTYAEVCLQVPPAATATAEWTLLELGARGTAQDLSHPDAGRTIVVGYFPIERTPERAAVLAVWARALRATATGGGPPEVTIHVRAWENWVEQTRRTPRAGRATERLWIAPAGDLPGALARPTDADLLVIAPGTAFGTGTHPTTRGCLELLERQPAGAPRGAALDLGTGTGILALRAAQCGYAPVFGNDMDREAVLTAARNARRNRLGAAVGFYAGQAEAIRPGARFQIILANLFLNPLLALATFFVAALAEHGALILSGFKGGDAAELRACLAVEGFTEIERTAHEDWVTMALARPARGPGPALANHERR